jgi:hypothetical protein
MSGVGSSAGPGAQRREQMIGALVPPATRRVSPVVPLVEVMLPRLALPTDINRGSVVLDQARLDASGRFSARNLLRGLCWLPGHRVDAAVVGEAVVFGGSVTGRQTVGSRGELAVPAAARTLAGFDRGSPVLLVAVPDRDVLIVHSYALLSSPRFGGASQA